MEILWCPASNGLAIHAFADERARVPIENRYGLRPAVVKETNQIAPLIAARDLDLHGLLKGVTTFNFHPHLPHYALTTEDTKLVQVLARQPIDMSRPHPFTEAGNREFNTFIWMPRTESEQPTSCWPTPQYYDVVWRRGILGELLEKPGIDPAHKRDADPTARTSRSRLIHQVLRIAVCYCHCPSPIRTSTSLVRVN